MTTKRETLSRPWEHGFRFRGEQFGRGLIAEAVRCYAGHWCVDRYEIDSVCGEPIPVQDQDRTRYFTWQQACAAARRWVEGIASEAEQ